MEVSRLIKALQLVEKQPELWYHAERVSEDAFAGDWCFIISILLHGEGEMRAKWNDAKRYQDADEDELEDMDFPHFDDGDVGEFGDWCRQQAEEWIMTGDNDGSIYDLDELDNAEELRSWLRDFVGGEAFDILYSAMKGEVRQRIVEQLATRGSEPAAPIPVAKPPRAKKNWDLGEDLSDLPPLD